MERLRKFLNLPAGDRWLTLEAAAWLVLALAVLGLLPFRWIAARFGVLSGGPPSSGIDAAFPLDERRQTAIRRVGMAVGRAARHLPCQAHCLPQAIVAKLMLHRRCIASTLHFGMRLATDGTGHRDGQRAGQRMEAHAWLTVGDMGVVGVPVSRGFTEIARFTHETAPSTAANTAAAGQSVHTVMMLHVDGEAENPPKYRDAPPDLLRLPE
jgi:hypothetical protein